MLFVDTVPEKLIQFLLQHLPPAMKGGEHCYNLAIPNPCTAGEIISNTNIACTGDTLHIDILRGVRMNIDKFFQNMKVCVSCNPIFCFLIVASSSKYSFMSCL
jgi:hypothetical protein